MTTAATEVIWYYKQQKNSLEIKYNFEIILASQGLHMLNILNYNL